MRILEVITPSRLGGAERYVGWIAKEWIEGGHEVLIGIRACEQVETFYSSLDLPVRRLNISGKINPFAKSRIAALVREFKPDVVHTHLSTASHWGLRAAKSLGIRAVGHMHSFNSVGPYKNADLVIAVSNAVKDHLQSHAIPASVVYPSSVIGSSAPAPDVMKLGSQVIACAARLREDKGIGVLVNAFARLQARFPDAALVLCGDGPMRPALEARAQSEGLHLHCLGYRSDVPAVFAAATVAVLPSIRPEGFGMALYEAQAVGTPVVATTAGGTQEAMVEGETGIAVPPDSAPALAEAMSNILSRPDLRAEMSAKAKAFGATRSIEASAKALLEALQS